MRITVLSILVFSTIVHAILRLKLQHWFKGYEDALISASTSDTCGLLLRNYIDDLRTQACDAPCACAADCILQQITPTMQSNFTSAQVLLGLVPAICVFIGPSLPELAVLSLQRPFLAILLGLGSPAINITRLFGRLDPVEPVREPRYRISKDFGDWLKRQPLWAARVFDSLCYAGAVAAIANNVWNSVNLDLKTMCGWRCGALFMPLVWSLQAVTIHLWGMLAIRLPRYNPAAKGSTQRENSWNRSFANLRNSTSTSLSECVFFFASVCVVVHMVFGIFDLSSLVFIGALEALWVAVVYFGSAAVCQMIVLAQLAKLKHESKSVLDTSASQPFDISLPASKSSPPNVTHAASLTGVRLASAVAA